MPPPLIDPDLVGEPGIPLLSPDRQSKKEEKLFGDEKREENKKGHIHKAFIFFLWISFVLFFVVLIVRVLHFILPADYFWLSSEQLQGIDKLIFSGAIGGFLGRYFKFQT